MWLPTISFRFLTPWTTGVIQRLILTLPSWKDNNIHIICLPLILLHLAVEMVFAIWVADWQATVVISPTSVTACSICINFRRWTMFDDVGMVIDLTTRSPVPRRRHVAGGGYQPILPWVVPYQSCCDHNDEKLFTCSLQWLRLTSMICTRAGLIFIVVSMLHNMVDADDVMEKCQRLARIGCEKSAEKRSETTDIPTSSALVGFCTSAIRLYPFSTLTPT